MDSGEPHPEPLPAQPLDDDESDDESESSENDNEAEQSTSSTVARYIYVFTCAWWLGLGYALAAGMLALTVFGMALVRLMPPSDTYTVGRYGSSSRVPRSRFLPPLAF